jgi:hypothetical protein
MSVSMEKHSSIRYLFTFHTTFTISWWLLNYLTRGQSPFSALINYVLSNWYCNIFQVKYVWLYFECKWSVHLFSGTWYSTCANSIVVNFWFFGGEHCVSRQECWCASQVGYLPGYPSPSLSYSSPPHSHPYLQLSLSSPLLGNLSRPLTYLCLPVSHSYLFVDLRPVSCQQFYICSWSLLIL